MKILKRVNLNQKMKNFLEYPVSIVSTPIGFGKTTSVHSFLENQNIYFIDFSFYNEIDESWSWNKIIHLLEKQIPYPIHYPSQIPTTRMELDLFIEDIKQYIEKPLIIVLDDVKLSSIPSFIKMIDLYTHIPSFHLHFIIITRDIIDGEMSKLALNNCFYLRTNDFTLTKQEFLQLCKIESTQLNETDFDYIYNYTEGWIVAAKLALNSYKSHHHFFNLGPLDSLIDEIIYKPLSPNVKIGFMKLSILNDFTLKQADSLCQDHETIETIIRFGKDNYFFQKIDYQKYRISPILKEYLKKELLLSSLDENELYVQVARLFLDQDKPLDALIMYLHCHEYQLIMDVLEQYKDISFTDFAPQIMINIFNVLPNKYKNEYPNVYLKWILDCITNLPQMNGEHLLDDYKKRIETNQIKGDERRLLGEYYFIHAFTYYNDVEKMIHDFIKAYQYFDSGYSQFAYPFMIATFGSYHMLYLYHNRVGRLQHIVSVIQQNVHYFIYISNGINYGSDEQILAEYAYETGNYYEVLPHALISYDCAMQKNQLSIAISSLFLQGRLALFHSQSGKFKNVILKLTSFYQLTDIPILHCEIDCALSFLYILNDDYDKVPKWLQNGQLENSKLLFEANTIAYIVYGMCLLKKHYYIELYETARVIEQINLDQLHIFALIYASLFKSISYYQRNIIDRSLHYFHQVIKLCEEDQIITPIIELSFYLNDIITLYIPKSDFEKKIKTSIRNYLVEKKQHPKKSIPSLTPKEIIILKLVSENKTIKDISISLNLSVNTIQTHMKSIYKKLNINSKVEAVQFYEKNRYFYEQKKKGL